MRTSIDRVLEVFDEESSPDVMALAEAVDFADRLIDELVIRRDAMQYELENLQ